LDKGKKVYARFAKLEIWGKVMKNEEHFSSFKGKAK
jgi:hypothetical protein